MMVLLWVFDFNFALLLVILVGPGKVWSFCEEEDLLWICDVIPVGATRLWPSYSCTPPAIHSVITTSIINYQPSLMLAPPIAGVDPLISEEQPRKSERGRNRALGKMKRLVERRTFFLWCFWFMVLFSVNGFIVVPGIIKMDDQNYNNWSIQRLAPE